MGPQWRMLSRETLQMASRLVSGVSRTNLHVRNRFGCMPMGMMVGHGRKSAHALCLSIPCKVDRRYGVNRAFRSTFLEGHRVRYYSGISQIQRRGLNEKSTFRFYSQGDVYFDVDANIHATVEAMIEGKPSVPEETLMDILKQLCSDGEAVVQYAASMASEDKNKDMSSGVRNLELSLVLCDDQYITELNKEWRGKDEPTDVLSFEIGHGDDMFGSEEWNEWKSTLDTADTVDNLNEISSYEEEEIADVESDLGGEQTYEDGSDTEQDIESLELIGDVIISIDTAKRQAKERKHSLLDECRILLVHGVLHLFGYDHEKDEQEAEIMETAESNIIQAMGWHSSGLIGSVADSQKGADHRVFSKSSKIELLALDMDGTLLDSNSKILPSSVEAIKAALKSDVQVMLATGKARPAAEAALRTVGLAGEGLVVGPKNPGIFLQGLAVHCYKGELIAGGILDAEIIRMAFEFAQEQNVSCVGFLGEECLTLKMTKEVEELHSRYYEPLAKVLDTVDEVLSGPPLRKLLFMASEDRIERDVKVHWERTLQNSAAEPMQAVPNMLEIVPSGWNKWVGMDALLKHEGLSVDCVMAIGDGMNDFELVKNVGVGISMANGVPAVKSIATEVVASNDEGGVAEAIHKYIL